MKKIYFNLKYYSDPHIIVNNKYFNLFGLQFFRSIFYRFIYSIIGLKYAFKDVNSQLQLEYLTELNENGIVVIKKFYSDSEFEAINNIILSLSDKLKTKSGDIKTRFPFTQTLDITNYTEDGIVILNDELSALTTNNKLIKEIAEIYQRRNINVPPKTYYFKQSYQNIDLTEYSKYDDLLHYDVFYKSVKAVLYLNDVTEKNAAFKYAKKSHKFSFRRLIGEILYSIDRFKPFNVADGTPLRAKYFNLSSLESFSAPKNSLIIFDSSGVHGRGTFSCGNDSRESIFIDFRSSYALINYLY